MDQQPSSVSRVQELVYELTINEVMTREVVTISPWASMRDLKNLLRDHRISGVPVVENERLVGIISIENLIQALEERNIDSPVKEHMTTSVHSLHPDDPLVKAVNFFALFGYGRFPVVQADNCLVGIITKGDILRATLRQMEVAWQSEEIHRYRASHIFEDIESEQTSLILRYNIKPQDFVRGGEASSKIKRALERLGAPPAVVRRVAVAVYEGETNVIIHSVGGEVSAEIHPEQVIIDIIDYGPGIPDVEQAMQPGYSTAPDWIRELGFGAGMGLTNIKNCADIMKLTSKMDEGTHLELTFKLQ
ncbi:MAG: CBS domain-containing protein [Chloroflexi bacterium]|nr:CBS domain-containing protein [Chloroflexota bacterium]